MKCNFQLLLVGVNCLLSSLFVGRSGAGVGSVQCTMETTMTDRKIDMYLALNAKMDLKIVFPVVRKTRVIKVCEVEDSQLKNYQDYQIREETDRCKKRGFDTSFAGENNIRNYQIYFLTLFLRVQYDVP